MQWEGGAVKVIIDSHSGVPVYRQIVDQVRFQVAAGILVPGAELPSTRVLSQELGVNPMTVSKSYALLEADGLLTRRPGLPLVVSEQPSAAAARERRTQLTTLLEPVAVAARQLGVTDEEAQEIFRRVLSTAALREEQDG
jgi:GntR family transcriptional regulator